MRIYPSLVFPLLTGVDAERAHDLTLSLLEIGQKSKVGRTLIRILAGKTPGKETVICGISFPNQLGVAAGFDKNARVVCGLSLLGFGHIEIGTLTPEPQSGNPRPRVFRLLSDKALINRMGFPNEGTSEIVARLAELSSKPTGAVLGVSIGKQKETPLQEAAGDYVKIMQEVYPVADYLAVNISSPNTPGLRELQHSTYLDDLLGTLVKERDELENQHNRRRCPLWIKIAPDLSWSQLDSVLDAMVKNRIDGVIATNTTIDRSGLVDQRAGEIGGLSGKPLTVRTNEIINYIYRKMNGQLPIIGVGGVFDSTDVRQKLDAGASLVQIYTGLVFEGPTIVGRILREIHH
jgi:dihydroorotate dehydrogenase